MKKPLYLDDEQLKILSTIIFEFCDSLDGRKDKHGNYKNDVWADCLQFRDEILPEIARLKKDEQQQN